jgi:hypothetical protein
VKYRVEIMSVAKPFCLKSPDVSWGIIILPECYESSVKF